MSDKEVENLKNELEYLKKQRDDQKKRIEKKIYSERKEFIESSFVLKRVILFTIISTAIFMGIYILVMGLDLVSLPLTIGFVLIIGFTFNKFYRKYRVKFINEEVGRILKSQMKNPNIMQKYTTDDEAQRMRIIIKEISERETKLARLGNKVDVVDVKVSNKSKFEV